MLKQNPLSARSLFEFTNDRWATQFAIGWVALWTIVRLAFTTTLPLTPDETNYWQWGRHLAWGYHDQAPLIGWAIGGATRLLGNHEWVVRLPSVLATAVCSLYLMLFARRWFGARTALAVVLLTQGSLLFNSGGVLATADGLQAAAWAAAAFHTARAYEEDTWRQWLLAGIWLGLGLLAKYTMVLFGICALLYGLFSTGHRCRLRSPKPYVAALVAVLLFSPVLWWNAAHGWNSARHVAHLGGVGRKAWLTLSNLGLFVSDQVALVSPLVLAGVLWAWIRLVMRQQDAQPWPLRFCWWTSAPVLAVFTILSLRTRVFGNWPAAGYLTGCVLLTALLVSSGTLRTRRFWQWLLGTVYAHGVAALLLVTLQTSAMALPLPQQWDERLVKELVGWERLGVRVAALRATLPDPPRTFLFGLRYQEASELAFYTPGQPQTVSINRWDRPNVYDYWWNDADLIGRDAVGVTISSNRCARELATVFERMDPPEVFPVYAPGRGPAQGREPIRTLYLYRCYGFKGGLRWQPPSRPDVRAEFGATRSLPAR